MAAKENNDSMIMVLLSVLLCLVLLEKSSKNPQSLLEKTSLQIPEITQPAKAVENPFLELKNYSAVDSAEVAPDNLEIPEIGEMPEFEEIAEESKNTIELYFLKFYGKGNKSHTRLIRIERQVPQSDKPEIEKILDALIMGPNAEEKSQGVLSAIPAGLNYSQNYKIENNILYLSLGSKFEYGAGPQMTQDRIDQLVFTLLQIEEIRGIRLYIDGKHITSLGGDGIKIPHTLTRSNRQIYNL